VDASTGVARWAQAYDRELNDVFAVEDDIVHAVAREMRLRLLGTVARRQTNSIAASELYLRARKLGDDAERLHDPGRDRMA
jgi:hypothetical protein